VKHISFALVLLLLAAHASAEKCLTKTESHDGKPITWETCVARVDDAVKTNVGGFWQINYIVRYKGQRLIVTDPLARSDYAIGKQICFEVYKLETPADSQPVDSQSLVFRTLNAMVDSNPANASCRS
jgi:hypothetical protein